MLDVSQSADASPVTTRDSRYNPDGGLIYEGLGAGDPVVGAGADGSALLQLIRTA